MTAVKRLDEPAGTRVHVPATWTGAAWEGATWTGGCHVDGGMPRGRGGATWTGCMYTTFETCAPWGVTITYARCHSATYSV